MKFEIYCDESNPDVFWSKSGYKAQYLLIGGIWLPSEMRQSLKHSIDDLKILHDFRSEIKWHKIHKDREDFYLSLIDLFMALGDQLRFRCIAVEGDKVDMVKFHEDDSELGFYKFYYQMIKHWILDFNEYRIFCDEKTNRMKNRLKVLRRTLDYANITSQVISVQALPSHEVVLLQFADFLLGIASSALNESVKENSAKTRIIKRLEEKLEIPAISPTPRSEQKYNIFKIDLRGGW